MLLALDSDAWARVVAAARPVLRDLPEPVRTPRSQQLASLPASRLSGGRGRTDLAALLAEGGALWVGVRAALEPDVLAVMTQDVPTRQQEPSPVTEEAEALRATVDDLRARLRELRGERDDLQRRLDGAEARAEAAEQRRRTASDELAAAEERASGLAARVAETDERREQAVAREARRREAEDRTLREELRGTRRDLEDARRTITRLRDQAAVPPPARPDHRVDDGRDLRPGRPSQIAAGVARPSREAAELLVRSPRLVLVDGWNVTRTHRAAWDWPEQRRWLVDATAAMALRQQVDVTVVFDAGSSGNTSGSTTRHGRVRVAYAPAQVTADDDIVFRVMAADPELPITVVTDDRELRGRLLEHGVDLVATAEWVWLLQ